MKSSENHVGWLLSWLYH